jgi:pSer/pThr/pTyr-binding forkhead associated (FHA) protein
MIRDYLDEQNWQTFGDVVVTLEDAPALHTGQFRVSSRVDPDVDRRARRSSQPSPGVGQMSQHPDQQYDQYGNPINPPGQSPQSGQQPAQPPAPQQGYQQYDPNAYQQYGQGQPPQQGYQQYDPNAYQQYGQGQPPQQGYQQYDPNAYQQYGQQPGPYPPAQPQPGYPPVPSGQQPAYQQPPAQYDPAYQQYAPPAQAPQYGQPAYPQQQPPSGAQPQPGYAQPQPGYGQPDYGQGYQQAAPADVVAVLSVDDGSHRTYQLQRGSNIVGRGQDAGFRLPDTSVSRRHIDIYFDGQVSVLHDLGSTNGTTVNGSSVQTWQLADGDVIRVGHSTVVFNVRG